MIASTMAFLFMRGKGHEVLPYDGTGGKVFQSDIAVHNFVNAFFSLFHASYHKRVYFSGLNVLHVW